MQTLTVRAYAGDTDLAPVCELLNLCDAVDQLDDNYSLEELRREFNEPTCDQERDLRLWEDGDGRLLAFGQTWKPQPGREDTHVEGYLYVRVHPDARAPELEDEIYAWGAERLREVGRERNLPARLGSGTMEHDSYGRAMFERWGLAATRRFYRMERPLDTPIAEPRFPEGFTLRHARVEDDEGWVEMFNQSFIDHWNHHPKTIEEFRHRTGEPPYDPSRNLIAVAPDGTFAAFCLCWVDPDANIRNRLDEGKIWLLGTRRGFRKIGLGRAMLLAGLHRLKADGMAVARLGVDAENPTGALRLYESAGFRVVYERVFYRRDL